MQCDSLDWSATELPSSPVNWLEKKISLLLSEVYRSFFNWHHSTGIMALRYSKFKQLYILEEEIRLKIYFEPEFHDFHVT